MGRRATRKIRIRVRPRVPTNNAGNGSRTARAQIERIGCRGGGRSEHSGGGIERKILTTRVGGETTKRRGSVDPARSIETKAGPTLRQ